MLRRCLKKFDSLLIYCPDFGLWYKRLKFRLCKTFRNHQYHTTFQRILFSRIYKTSFFMSADIMSSLCGVGVHVRVNNFFSKTTRPRDMLFFFLKIPYLSRMKKCSRHANLSVRLFARDVTREVPPPKV